jgi:hypothetical protein
VQLALWKCVAAGIIDTNFEFAGARAAGIIAGEPPRRSSELHWDNGRGEPRHTSVGGQRAAADE